MVSIIIQEHHIGYLTSLYIGALFFNREQDEIGDFPGLFFSKKRNSPALNPAPQKKLQYYNFYLNL